MYFLNAVYGSPDMRFIASELEKKFGTFRQFPHFSIVWNRPFLRPPAGLYFPLAHASTVITNHSTAGLHHGIPDII